MVSGPWSGPRPPNLQIGARAPQPRGGDATPRREATTKAALRSQAPESGGEDGAAVGEQLAQHGAVAVPLVGAVAADRQARLP